MMEFRFRGGRICLDFTSTLGGRYRAGEEQLDSPADLSQWFALSMPLSGHPPHPARDAREAPDAREAREAPDRDADRQLRHARELREAIYRLVHPDSRGRPDPGDIAVVNRWAARPDFAPALGADARTVIRQAGRQTEAGLAAVARDAIDLLTGPLLERVRECGRADCSVLFLDLSRPGQRRWCDMQSCGNRIKARRYRRAHGPRPEDANLPDDSPSHGRRMTDDYDTGDGQHAPPANHLAHDSGQAGPG
jgi:predicted RNA-binding Zn ribbon-like protein